METLKDAWACGAFTDQGQFGTAILNAEAIGKVNAYAHIRDIEFDQLEGLDNDE